MKEISDEINLTISLMQTDIDDGAHSELQGHLYSLLEMKRNELQQRLVDRLELGTADTHDLSPFKTVIKPYGQITTDYKPLTLGELKDGRWWCADISQDCAVAFKSKGLRVFNSGKWLDDGAWNGCVMGDEGDIVRVFSGFDGKKQIHRIGNNFYWSEK